MAGSPRLSVSPHITSGSFACREHVFRVGSPHPPPSLTTRLGCAAGALRPGAGAAVEVLAAAAPAEEAPAAAAGRISRHPGRCDDSAHQLPRSAALPPLRKQARLAPFTGPSRRLGKSWRGYSAASAPFAWARPLLGGAGRQRPRLRAAEHRRRRRRGTVARAGGRGGRRRRRRAQPADRATAGPGLVRDLSAVVQPAAAGGPGVRAAGCHRAGSLGAQAATLLLLLLLGGGGGTRVRAAGGGARNRPHHREGARHPAPRRLRHRHRHRHRHRLRRRGSPRRRRRL
eukprot:COSAG01_NODE_8799_length_2655_cov_4.509390_2_plen_286_part_00